MKFGIHPQIYSDAVCTCTTCGAEFKIPSTKKEVQVEVCMYCHPVYTGKQQQERKGGRVERFRKRMAASKGK